MYLKSEKYNLIKYKTVNTENKKYTIVNAIIFNNIYWKLPIPILILYYFHFVKENERHFFRNKNIYEYLGLSYELYV